MRRTKSVIRSCPAYAEGTIIAELVVKDEDLVVAALFVGVVASVIVLEIKSSFISMANEHWSQCFFTNQRWHIVPNWGNNRMSLPFSVSISRKKHCHDLTLAQDLSQNMTWILQDSLIKACTSSLTSS